MLSYSEVSPPDTLTVNSVEYPIDTDFRTWIKINEQLDEYDDNAPEEHRFEVLLKCVKLAFGTIIDEPLEASIKAITEFMNGYETDTASDGNSTSPTVFSFTHDINLVAVAFASQYGLDLSYSGEKIHWWKFLVLLGGLEERHRVSQIIGYRGYKGKDKEMLKLKKQFAIPRKISAEKKRQRDELAGYFGQLRR